MRNIRLAELIFNQPLMIAESKLNVILHALGPRFNIDMSGIPAQETVVMSDQERRRSGYAVSNGVAMIGVHGPLLHRLLASEYPSGGPTTYSDIRRALDTALADDGVDAIILDVDSPGGMVSGTFDLADHIYQSRSIKPITAVVNESAFSSGYLLASSASRIIIPRTAMVGSVGVIATHADFSRAEDQAGITVTHVYAGARKADGSPHMPLSAEAFAELQSGVNDTYQLFVETVARNRKLKTETVRETEAGIFKSKKAVSIGFADEIATYTAAVSSVKRSNSSRIFTASAEPKGKEIQKMNIEEMKQQYPDLCQSLIEEGRKQATADLNSEALNAAREEGATAERNRIRSVEEAAACAPGHEALIAGLKYDGKTTAGEAALQILGAEQALRAGALSTMKTDANSAVPAAGASATGDTPPAQSVNDDDGDLTEEAAQARFQASADLRREFGGSFKAYFAFVKASQAGRARILGS